jgi:hypothetical protein
MGRRKEDAEPRTKFVGRYENGVLITGWVDDLPKVPTIHNSPIYFDEDFNSTNEPDMYKLATFGNDVRTYLLKYDEGDYNKQPSYILMSKEAIQLIPENIKAMITNRIQFNF